MPNQNQNKPPAYPGNLLCIGGGNMADAILTGALNAGILNPAQLTVADPNPDRRAIFTARDIATFQSASDALEHIRSHDAVSATQPTTILLAIKPQMLDAVALETRDAIALAARQPPGRITLISILAGVTIERLTTAFSPPTGTLDCIRVMPNTPALVGKGMSAICAHASVPKPQLENVRKLFASLGDVVTLEESLMDAFTAVAGSGPAYLFLLAEALENAATHLGFDQQTAARIAKQTITGSATLLDQTTDPPSTLRARVTSPAGTTAAALGVLEREDFTGIITKAVTAARDRGRELSNNSKSNT